MMRIYRLLVGTYKMQSLSCVLLEIDVPSLENSFGIKPITPRAKLLAKVAQFNFQPQRVHLHLIKMETLLLIFTMISCIKVNSPEFISHSMLEPREQLAFSYLLTKVFAYYNVDLSNETPSLGK